MSEPATKRRLVDRLRGIYTVPVNDGAGLLDGKDTFTRTFHVRPIMREAADEIERQQRLIDQLAKALEDARNTLDDIRGQQPWSCPTCQRRMRWDEGQDEALLAAIEAADSILKRAKQ